MIGDDGFLQEAHTSTPYSGLSTGIMDRDVKKVAHTDSTVLIQGETGVGKELIARMIHKWSPHRGHAFGPINCSALSTGVMESELFGHEKGAFTGAVDTRMGFFELADKGTILLDGIGTTDQQFQVKLLRVLQDKFIYKAALTYYGSFAIKTSPVRELGITYP